MQKYSVYQIINYKDMGVYYGHTNNFEVRKYQHQRNIRMKDHLNDTFLAAAEKYHWTDFKIQEIERFNFQIEARLKEKELIIMSDKNPNHKLYNEKVPTKDADYLTMRVVDELGKKFLAYAKKHDLNRSELSRMIISDYLDGDDKKITWSFQDIKPKDKVQISANITNELLKDLEYFSEINKIDKKRIYHTAMEQFFDKNKT
jgi:predicted GIY-YIG superfamily endonuclease